MSLPLFLDHIAQAPAELRSFFDQSRHAMLRVLGRKFWYAHHQLLEDAVMQAFAQLWDGELTKFSSAHPMQSDGYKNDLIRLMCTVARRRLIDVLRRKKIEIPISELKTSNEGDTPDDELFDSLLPPSNADPVTGDLERRQQLRRLQRCVDHLTPKLREVVEGLLEDVRQIDTAQALGIPEGTVKSRMNEAIKKLKRCMGLDTEGTV